ncbi:hypothetical protein B0H17DRAFT_1141498 [Mycena rosella]|uniref:Uncharacterized protein n=1 Tax=Mycena rosella TaxID=1033263 RepID=A0AAD7CZG4_MYCRO|nr:hypothetical protein B0H17DRAFT_1141498 [Mycena rosella]
MYLWIVHDPQGELVILVEWELKCSAKVRELPPILVLNSGLGLGLGLWLVACAEWLASVQNGLGSLEWFGARAKWLATLPNANGDDDKREVQCEQCRFWSHMDCITSLVNWNDPVVHFICKRCRPWPDPLIELFSSNQIVMLPDSGLADWKSTTPLWYPARFIKRHEKRVNQPNEYEFRWLECNDGTLFTSDDSILPLLMLRTCLRGRKFYREIEDIKLTDTQIGRTRRPLYMEPDNPNHENPALTAVFNSALPGIAEILAEFNHDHPVIKDFNEYFAGKKEIQRHRGTGQWIADMGLVPTPELEAVLMTPLSALLRHGVSYLIEDERNQRVMGIGSVLLQLLAIQMELGKLLNLNGDLLVDLRDRAVTPCPTDGATALEAMFGAIRVPSGKAAICFKQMMEFNRDHTIYDAQFRPPTFHRDDPSFSAPTEAIPVIVKRPGELKIKGERPKKRAKAGILGNQLKVQTPGHSRSPSARGRKLCSGKIV